MLLKSISFSVFIFHATAGSGYISPNHDDKFTNKCQINKKNDGYIKSYVILRKACYNYKL